jgi:hypothetical protein
VSTIGAVFEILLKNEKVLSFFRGANIEHFS